MPTTTLQTCVHNRTCGHFSSPLRDRRSQARSFSRSRKGGRRRRGTNNVVERAIRPLALNRKNALFAGSDGGAEHWAVIASLIETCKLIEVEPHGYLADVITRIINGHPQSRLDELLPWAYPATP